MSTATLRNQYRRTSPERYRAPRVRSTRPYPNRWAPQPRSVRVPGSRVPLLSRASLPGALSAILGFPARIPEPIYSPAPFPEPGLEPEPQPIVNAGGIAAQLQPVEMGARIDRWYAPLPVSPHLRVAPRRVAVEVSQDPAVAETGAEHRLSFYGRPLGHKGITVGWRYSQLVGTRKVRKDKKGRDGLRYRALLSFINRTWGAADELLDLWEAIAWNTTIDGVPLATRS